jgi:hypothetical protein
MYMSSKFFEHVHRPSSDLQSLAHKLDTKNEAQEQAELRAKKYFVKKLLKLSKLYIKEEALFFRKVSKFFCIY